MIHALALLLLGFAAVLNAADRPTVLLIIGAPGADQYGEKFQTWATQWEKAATQGETTLHIFGATNDKQIKTNDRTRLKQHLKTQSKKSPHPLWIVLLGHGTYDGKTARFNLRGPDLAAADLATWLKDFERPIALLNCAAASAPFLRALSGENRVVLTATRSGFEQNFCHLGGHLATALSDAAADLDKDGQVSLLEAWLTAARRTAYFYKTEGRLATEHSLLEDNADAKGTPPDWFRGIRATQRAEDVALPDGLRAHQFHLIPNETEKKLHPKTRAQRNTLELQLAHLRTQKEDLKEDEYYRQLEPLLLQLARLYDSKPPVNKP